MGKLSGILCVTLPLLIQPVWAQDEVKHLVDIGGGRHLNMVCSGTGSPTVVFLQGLGSDITDWRKIRQPIGALTRECFYDRAGFGYSDPSDKPSTAENITDDLHALLRAAKITDHVVLVGHSAGGLFATLYTDRFEPEVAGLVLVDPSFAGQFDMAVNPQDNAIMAPEDEQWYSSMRTCEKLAQDGKLSTVNPHDCGMPSSQALETQGLNPAEVEYLMLQFHRPSYYATVLSESENFSTKDAVRAPGAEGVDGAQERRVARSFGNLPLEVLTAAVTFHNPNVSDATNDAIENLWKLGHDKLARRSTRGESIVIPNSRHFIQIDQPDAVVAAISKVVSEARQH